MKIDKVKTSELVLLADNTKTHPQSQIDRIVRSIEEFGWTNPLIVLRETREVLAGNARLEAALKAGIATVPVIYVDMDRDKGLAYSIADNRLAELAEWDDDALRKVFSRLDDVGIDLDLTGFDEDALAAFNPPEIVEDEIPEPPAEPITRMGDLWICGEHRVLCGDSTKAEDVERVMGREKAVLMATDPPYGVAYGVETGIGSKFGAIENDENDGLRLQGFLEAAFSACLPHLKKKAAWYLWHAQMTQGFFAAAAAAAAADVIIHRQIIWVKPSLILGHGDYHWRHELCFYGWRKGNRPEWYGDRKQTTVWEIGRENEKIHPTQKPVRLFAIPISNHTRKGEVIYEPFTGSGSQLIAAEQLSRRCYGIEIEPRYVDVTVKRWENLTGKTARRDGD